MNAGSCRWGSDGDRLDYDRLAETLVPYAKDLGFTHIELLPISEHPFTGSWGYQPLGLFAPTNRFGPPEAFARFVDRCHQEGIGLIVDWVPAHCPSDAPGLGRFDGTALYELGRASCRERVGQYVTIQVVAVSLKKHNQTTKLLHYRKLIQ